MPIALRNMNGTDIAILTGPGKQIIDAKSALDLAITVKYETGAAKIAIDKEAITDEFFILSSGLAGEILQKFVNYQIQAAIYGDFSRYTSKPLRDFIYESNQGRDIFFQPDCEQAVLKLCEA